MLPDSDGSDSDGSRDVDDLDSGSSICCLILTALEIWTKIDSGSSVFHDSDGSRYVDFGGAVSCHPVPMFQLFCCTKSVQRLQPDYFFQVQGKVRSTEKASK